MNIIIRTQSSARIIVCVCNVDRLGFSAKDLLTRWTEIYLLALHRIASHASHATQCNAIQHIPPFKTTGRTRSKRKRGSEKELC